MSEPVGPDRLARERSRIFTEIVRELVALEEHFTNQLVFPAGEWRTICKLFPLIPQVVIRLDPNRLVKWTLVFDDGMDTYKHVTTLFEGTRLLDEARSFDVHFQIRWLTQVLRGYTALVDPEQDDRQRTDTRVCTENRVLEDLTKGLEERSRFIDLGGDTC